MRHVLITGAAGFIGSHLSEALTRSGWRVRGVDAFTDTYDPSFKHRNLRGLRDDPAFELVAADLVSADLEGLLAGVDAVVHLGGEPGVATSWGSGFATYVERNVLATQRLLEAVATVGVRRFVYASSSSVYGPSGRQVRESARLAPLSPYGASKLAGECLVGAYAHQRGLSAVSLRFFSVYGPRQRPDMAAHRFIEAVLDHRVVPVYGDGGQARDFTYVDDVVGAVVAAMTADVPAGTVLNIAHGEPVTVRSLIQLVGAELDTEVRVERRPHRRGDTMRTHGNAAAAKALLSWQASTGIADGIRRQVAWHLAQRVAGTSVGPVLVGTPAADRGAFVEATMSPLAGLPAASGLT